MPERSRYRPFTGDTERRIRLSHPPLPLVLCQVRWPELTELQGGLDAHAVAMGAMLDGYPFHDQNQELAVTITPEGLTSAPGEVVHQWHSQDRTWHVALSRRSVAVFCTNYSSFELFSERLGSVLTAVAATITIPGIERVGLRYVNRVVDSQTVADLEEILDRAVLGFASVKAISSDVTRLTSLNQVVYSLGTDRLQARSGVLAPGETVDPAIPPVNLPSWILDLDSFRESPGPFDRETVIAAVGRLADINYDFFKFVASDEYIRKVEEKR